MRKNKSDSLSLIGKWVFSKEYSGSDGIFNVCIDVIFYKNGNGKLQWSETGVIPQNLKFSYKASGNKIISLFNTLDARMLATYFVEKDQLYIWYDKSSDLLVLKKY